MMEASARFVDGRTAAVRDVVLLMDEGAGQVLVRHGDQIIDRWPVGEVRCVSNEFEGGLPRLRHGEARATLQDPSFIDGLRWHTRDLYKRDPVPGQMRKVALWSLAAVVSVVLIVLVVVPALANRLAPVIPVEREEQLADAALDQMRWFLDIEPGESSFCTSTDGLAALQKMFDRFTPHYETDYEIRVDVIDHDMVNAFALPGGRILLFDGLLQKADTPEQVAGVLGHEIGHVVLRDPTRLALRSAGTLGVLGLLLGDFSGGSVLLLAGNRVLQASYSQGAETMADAFAIRIMAGARLPSAALGDMFDMFAKIGGEEEGQGGILSHLASHPDSFGRARAARDGDVIGTEGFEPVLTDTEWRALQGICNG